MFYAIAIYKATEEATEINDLVRFERKKTRDIYVDAVKWYNSENYCNCYHAVSITRKDAELKYKEQFSYWKAN